MCQDRTLAPQQTASLFGGLGGFQNSRQPDREGRAAAGFALDRDVTAHHLTKASANGEAKTRRRGGRSLGKFLEQLAHLFRRLNNATEGHGMVSVESICLPSLHWEG
jgi:hypothetical protein